MLANTWWNIAVFLITLANITHGETLQSFWSCWQHTTHGTCNTWWNVSLLIMLANTTHGIGNTWWNVTFLIMLASTIHGKTLKSFWSCWQRENHIRQKPTWICSISEHLGLVPVLQEVLDVAHLVVDGDQIFLIHGRAHLDPETPAKRNNRHSNTDLGSHSPPTTPPNLHPSTINHAVYVEVMHRWINQAKCFRRITRNRDWGCLFELEWISEWWTKHIVISFEWEKNPTVRAAKLSPCRLKILQ